MPSWQARAASVTLRLFFKRRLARIDSADTAAVAAVRARLAAIEPYAEFPKGRRHVEPLDAGGVPCEWVRAPGARSGHALLYLHGGAYVCGSPALYRDLARRLSAACAAPVLVPDYRLAPEHPFPAALEDARRAWRWLRTTPAADHAAIAGDSAGGGLALALLLAERDAGAALPRCAVCFSPWTDLGGSGDSMRDNARRESWLPAHLVAGVARLYLGGHRAEDPYASPLFGDPRGLPPLLLHVGEDEILRDDTTRLAARTRAAGVATRVHLWAGTPHALPLFARIVPEARRCIEESGAFTRRHTDR